MRIDNVANRRFKEDTLLTRKKKKKIEKEETKMYNYQIYLITFTHAIIQISLKI